MKEKKKERKDTRHPKGMATNPTRRDTEWLLSIEYCTSDDDKKYGSKRV
jgi:hypothetical protein